MAVTRQHPVNRRFRVPRIWSNGELHRIAPLFDGAVINVSGWADRDKEGSVYRDYFPNAADYRVSNHAGAEGTADPESVTDHEIDLEMPLAEGLHGTFDVVFSHTTLEHVFEVRRAFANLCALSRDVVIVVVPFAQELHYSDSYGDFWRFSPMCLRRLFAENGLEVVYEAASPHEDAGIYVMAVGSRRPGVWRSQMPDWKPVESLGEWIGGRRSVSAALLELARRAGRRLRVQMYLPRRIGSSGP